MSDMSIRPEVADMYVTPYDRLGRKQPRRLGPPVVLQRHPEIVRAFKDVPDEFYALDVNGDGYTEAVVACPCGEDEPRIEIGLMQKCSGCGRIYWYVGSRLMALKPTSAPDEADD